MGGLECSLQANATQTLFVIRTTPMKQNLWLNSCPIPVKIGCSPIECLSEATGNITARKKRKFQLQLLRNSDE